MSITKYSEGTIGAVIKTKNDKEKEELDQKLSEAIKEENLTKEASETDNPFWSN